MSSVYIRVRYLDLPCLEMIESANEKTVKERKSENSQFSGSKRKSRIFIVHALFSSFDANSLEIKCVEKLLHISNISSSNFGP